MVSAGLRTSGAARAILARAQPGSVGIMLSGEASLFISVCRAARAAGEPPRLARFGRLVGSMLVLRRREGAWSIAIAGTRVCALFGRELGGRAPERLFLPHDREDVAALIDAVAEEGVEVALSLSGWPHADGDAPRRPTPLDAVLVPAVSPEAGASALFMLAPRAEPPASGIEALGLSGIRVLAPPGRPDRARPILRVIEGAAAGTSAVSSKG
jgi:hypothetical protein